MKKAIKIFIPVLVMAMLFTACTSASKNNDDKLEDGVNAVENAMTTKGNQENKNNNTDDLRTGNSNNTVPTPSDFPSEYNYGTGKLSDYSRNAMLKKMPTPNGNQTVSNTKADASEVQVLYLWEKDNVPAKTKFTKKIREKNPRKKRKG